jgi:hypothetical protein
LDSVSKTCLVYDTMYNIIRERIFKYPYKPSNMPALLDSLAASRNSATAFLSTSMNDSISVLNKQNADLKAVIETLSTQEIQSAKAVNDLKKLKELLDAQIITQAEFDAKKAVLLEKL